jgi:transposase
VPNIPPKANSRWKNCFSTRAATPSNGFCRVKDCRRLAIRFDKLTANFLGAIHLAAAIIWWL